MLRNEQPLKAPKNLQDAVQYLFAAKFAKAFKKLHRKKTSDHCMEIIEPINNKNYSQAAKLSVKLWPDNDIEEMTTYYEDIMQTGKANCFLLRNKWGYIGFIELSIRNNYVEGAETLPVAYIEGLFIKKKYRCKGHGQLLIEKAEDWARSKGFKQLCSDAELENNSSIDFHISAGFVEVSRIVCFAKDI